MYTSDILLNAFTFLLTYLVTRLCRRHRVCWWSVNDDDELPGQHVVRRSATVAATVAPTEAATASDSSTQNDGLAVYSVRDCVSANATSSAAADVADYSQLNHVVRESDVLKSVTNCCLCTLGSGDQSPLYRAIELIFLNIVFLGFSKT